MTRLDGDKRIRRETSSVVQRKPLVVEIRPHTIYMRLKGARWGYEVDYHSIWVLGAKKVAEQARIERQNKRSRRTAGM